MCSFEELTNDGGSIGSNATAGITPLHIEIALYYCKPRDSEAVACMGHNIDAVAQIHREFTEAGLLEITGDDKLWKATDGMHRYVEALCRVPLPVMQSEKAPDNISQLDPTLEKRHKYIGDYTIKTRNSKIAAAMAEYLASAPQAIL